MENRLDLEKKIIHACEYGNFTKVKELVLGHKDLDLNLKFNNYTPLHASCISDSVEITQFLLEQGVDINLKMNEDYTALMIAASNGYNKCFNLLIGQGADLNAVTQSGRTALMEAIDYSSFENAIELVRLGANSFILDNQSLGAIEHVLIKAIYKKDIFTLHNNKEHKLMLELFSILVQQNELAYKSEDKKTTLIGFYNNLMSTYKESRHSDYMEYIKIKKEKLDLDMEIGFSQDVNGVGEAKKMLEKI